MKRLDFTINKYEELCRSIVSAGYRTLTVKDYLLTPPSPNESIIILRHDVDRKPWNAFGMSVLEKDLGLSSTYYFRYIPSVFKRELIKKIYEFNHEIGYHYETLSKTKGRYNDAIRLFEKELNEFRKIVDVQTICMHGSPLSKWDNRSLWRDYDFRKAGVLGAFYLSIDFSKLEYFTDTGRSWSADRTNIRDRVEGYASRKIKNTDHLIALIQSRQSSHICIQTHPERWDSNISDWTITLARDRMANLIKVMIVSIHQMRNMTRQRTYDD